jgi:antitoxin component of RelBE/YafQ-DinJ toxin-antitoxin module
VIILRIRKYTKYFGVRLENNQYVELLRVAREKGLTPTDVIRLLVSKLIKNRIDISGLEIADYKKQQKKNRKQNQ